MTRAIDVNYSATSTRSVDHFQIIDADMGALATNNSAGICEADSLSASPAAYHSLFVFRRRAASIIDQPRRPRVKMIILLWATWMVAAVAYLCVVRAQ